MKHSNEPMRLYVSSARSTGRMMLITSLCTAALTLVQSQDSRGAPAETYPAKVTSDAYPRKLPKKMQCHALQTVGLHDYAGAPESYQPSTFFESKFELRINNVLTRHLAASGSGAAEATPDLFLTMRPRNESPIELRCREVRGLGGEPGYSCTNTPPSELLLINPANLRFTRTSIGGWTFADTPPAPKESTNIGAATIPNSGNLGDDSLFVEYGTCE